jgi:C4-dicarboxylate transporter DctM subunit
VNYELFVGISATVSVLVLLSMRVPIGIALAVPSILGIALVTEDLEAGARSALVATFDAFNRESFVIIPLFVAMATLSTTTGMTAGVFEALKRWVGRMRGGLGVATSLGSGMFAAVSGSSLATVTMMSKVALTEMERAGYHRQLATGIIAASGTVGILIPPSIILVLYAILSDTSVGAVLLAGIIPGILTVIANVVTVMVLARRKPDWAPLVPLENRLTHVQAIAKCTPVLVIFLVVVGGLYAGIWTAAESAAAGVVTVVIIGLLRRKLDRKAMWNSLSEAVTMSVSIAFMLAGAFILTRLLSITGVTQAIAEGLTQIHGGRAVTLAIFILTLLVLGTFLEGLTIMAIALPIMTPVIIELGYSPVWFAIIIVKTIEIAVISPPIGLNMYAISATRPDIPVNIIFRGVVPFYVAELVIILLIIFIPDIALWLPSLQG